MKLYTQPLRRSNQNNLFDCHSYLLDVRLFELRVALTLTGVTHTARAEQPSSLSANKCTGYSISAASIERPFFSRRTACSSFSIRNARTGSAPSIALTQIQLCGDPWPRPRYCRPLTDQEVCLPRALEEFPGFESERLERPRYGFSELSQNFVSERAQRATNCDCPARYSSASPATSDQTFYQPAYNNLPDCVAQNLVRYFVG